MKKREYLPEYVDVFEMIQELEQRLMTTLLQKDKSVSPNTIRKISLEVCKDWELTDKQAELFIANETMGTTALTR